jgi:hypothetical protein
MKTTLCFYTYAVIVIENFIMYWTYAVIIIPLVIMFVIITNVYYELCYYTTTGSVT